MLHQHRQRITEIERRKICNEKDFSQMLVNSGKIQISSRGLKSRGCFFLSVVIVVVFFLSLELVCSFFSPSRLLLPSCIDSSSSSFHRIKVF